MELDHALRPIAEAQHGLVTRAQVLAAGGTGKGIAVRLEGGRWSSPQDGVYLLGAGPSSWRQSVMAASLAAGPEAVASHRAAALLWELDGLKTAPVEVTVPYGDNPRPAGAVWHRTRVWRPGDHAVRDGIPVTTVERTLLDLGQFKRHEVVVEKALESAIRKGLTTEAKVRLWLETGRRRGRKGVTLLRHVLDLREGGRPAGSGAEVSLIRLLRRAGVPRAVRQHSIRLRHDEVAVVDLAWPGRRVAVEFDGFEHHGGRRAWYHGIARDNAIRDAGWTLRRYTWDDLTKRPEAIVEAVFRLLCASAAA